MRRVMGVGLLVLAGVTGPLLSIPIWISVWDRGLEVWRGPWDGLGVALLAWFLLPAAITAVLGAPVLLWNRAYVAATSAMSGAAGLSLTYVTFVAYGSAGLD